jgi:hypothetical protein
MFFLNEGIDKRITANNERNEIMKFAIVIFGLSTFSVRAKSPAPIKHNNNAD